MTFDSSDPQYQAYSDAKGRRLHPAVRAIKQMSYILVGAVVVLSCILPSMTSGNPTEVTPMIAGVLLGLAAAGLIPLIGYRIEPLPAGTRPEVNTVLAAYRSGMMLRFALAEGVTIMAFALTIVFAGNLVSYLPGALISLALLVVHVLPNRTMVRRVEQRLDADGAQSGLSAMFGY